jgi:hypothetical protein
MSRPFGPSRSGGLALVLSLLLVACARRAEPELHNIPDGFTGRVFILHDVVGGAPAQYDSGNGLTDPQWRIYDIPSDGILRSTTSMPEGTWEEGDVLYCHQDGHWLTYLSTLEDTPEHRADDSVAVYNRHSLVVSSPDTPCPVEVECYSVGTQAALLDDPADERAERAWLLEYLQQHAVQCSRRHGRRRRLPAVTAPRP